jgi:hypothetical protein
MKLAKLDFPAAPLHFSSSHKVLHDFMYEAVWCDAVWFGGTAKRLLKWWVNRYIWFHESLSHQMFDINLEY